MKKTTIILLTLLAMALSLPNAFAQSTHNSNLDDVWPVRNNSTVGSHDYLPGGDFTGNTRVFVWGKALALPQSWTNKENSSDAVANTIGDVTAATGEVRTSYPIGVEDARSVSVQIWSVSESNYVGTVVDDAADGAYPAAGWSVDTAGSTYPAIGAVTAALSVLDATKGLVGFRALGSMAILGASAGSRAGSSPNIEIENHLLAAELPWVTLNVDNYQTRYLGFAGAAEDSTTSYKSPRSVAFATIAGMYEIPTQGMRWLTLVGYITNSVHNGTFVTVIRKNPY